MAKDNIYSVLQKPVAKHGRNSFNLNNQHVYSMKAGQIIPIKAVHFMPNDYLKMKAKDFSITFPMNSAPFLRARKEFSFYSVYYSAVWSLFNQYMAGRQDPKSSAFGINPVLQEPRIKLANLYSRCLNHFVSYVFMEHVLPACIYYDGGGELTQGQIDRISREARQTYLDGEYDGDFIASSVYEIGESTITCTLDVHSSSPFTFTQAFAPSPWEVAEQDSVRNSRVHMDVVGHHRVYNTLRKLDMLGYGNYYESFRYYEDVIRGFSPLTSDNPQSSRSDYLNAVGVAIVALGKLVLSSFATWDKSLYTVDNVTQDNITSWKMVNLYPICAYNAVFYHFFRNSFYDNNYLSHDYSLDFVSAANGGYGYNEVSSLDFSSRFLDIEYHQWKKDMFTSVLPDEQFGAVSSISLNSVTLDNTRFSNNSETSLGNKITINTGTSRLYSFNDSTQLGTVNLAHKHNFEVEFDMIALKRAEMLQEYRQTLMRAGNKTSDVFRALYGGSPSSEHEDDIIPRFLETFGEDLVVDPVISTADTGQPTNGALGDIAARGKSSGESNSFSFNAGDNFGCILCLAYVVPSAMYNSYMLDKHLLELSPEQHFIPNFENIGLEDIYTDELNMLIPANDMASLGKQARYYHKKTDVDKVHGAFCSSMRQAWFGGSVPQFDLLNKSQMFFGEFNHWISVRTDMQSRNITTLRDFYINPSVLDNVFVRAAGADQADDQFLCTTLLEVDATKAISKTGFVNFV